MGLSAGLIMGLSAGLIMGLSAGLIMGLSTGTVPGGRGPSRLTYQDSIPRPLTRYAGDRGRPGGGTDVAYVTL